MAVRLPDGSIRLNDGRVLYANSIILAQDLVELIPLLAPPPLWPFVSGGGGGGTGVVGRNGANGAQGAQGPGGAFGGPQGVQGNQGIGGVQGNQGNQGPIGTGAQGSQGNQGTSGAQGNQGNQGPTGTGAQGNQGNQGSSGSQGNQGNQGSTGPQGSQGNQGSSGSQGNQGNQGALGIQGTQGPQGNAGSQGSQGNQGNQGALGIQGTQGAQGDEGPQGVQGNQGNQGALGTQGAQGWQGDQGPQGSQGPQGFQGWQGFQGDGPQGFQGIQGFQGFQGSQGNQGVSGPQGLLSNDIFAADRVVDPGGAGTDTTLASALAALPSSGGTIYVKAGTYPISATMILPLKNVRIIGAGANLNSLSVPDATVFDLGANAIPLFQTAAGGGGTTFGSYYFSDFEVIGTTLLGQSFIEAPMGVLGSTITCERVSVNTIQTVILNTAGADLDVTFRDSVLDPRTASASFWNSPTPNGELTWDHVAATIVAGGSALAITGGPDWTVFDSYIGGPPGFSTYNVKSINWVDFFLGKDADKAQVTVTAAISTIVSCQFIGVSLIFNTTLVFVSNSWFSGSSTGVNAQVTCNGVAGAGNMNFHGVNFDASGAAAGNGLVIAGITNVAVTGCQFEGHTTDGIHITGTSTVSVTGCRFSEAVPLNETTTTITGRYTGNVGFASSVIQGPDTVVEEFRRKDVVGGATVDALTAVFTHTNDKGLAGAGAIKNTGGNSLTIRRTGTDAFGVTDFQEDTVLAGASLTWPMDTALGTALPSFTVFTVSVRSTTAGNPTTFDLHHASTGAY